MVKDSTSGDCGGGRNFKLLRQKWSAAVIEEGGVLFIDQEVWDSEAESENIELMHTWHILDTKQLQCSEKRN